MRHYAENANQDLLAHLKTTATAKHPGEHSPWDVDEYVLRTHPDLHDRMVQVADELPVKIERAAYGYPVLCTLKGVIFCLSMGTSTLGMRLPAAEADLARQQGAKPMPELGGEWMAFDPWNADAPTAEWLRRLRSWMAIAYGHASTLAER